MMGFLAEYPLALYPVSAELPFEQGLDTRSRADFERIFRAQAPLFPAATLGLPALSAPVGMAQGLPVGVQLMASRFRDDLLLDAAEVLEARFPGAGPIDPRAWAGPGCAARAHGKARAVGRAPAWVSETPPGAFPGRQPRPRGRSR